VDKLSILYITPSVAIPSFHGSSTHVLELSRNLVKLGCNVIVLARRLPAQSPSEVIEGIKVFRIWRGMFKAVSTDSLQVTSDFTRKYLKPLEGLYFNTVYAAFVSSLAFYLTNKYKVNVILERGDSYCTGAFVSLVSGIPLITEIRDVYQPKISLIVAKKLLVYDASILKDKKFLSKTAIMHGGVDVEKFKPMGKQDAKAALGLLNKFVIGYSGSFAPSHKLDIMITLAERLQKVYDSKVHFLIVGPANPQLLKTVRSLNLEHHFSFVGSIFHDELPKYLNAMDVGLALYNPNMIAGPPYKVYEYMACGVPAITTETIYSRKFVKNGLNGFLVRMNNIEDILNKIILLIENPNLLNEISVKARETALKFSWKEETSRILNLLKSVYASSACASHDRSTSKPNHGSRKPKVFGSR